MPPCHAWWSSHCVLSHSLLEGWTLLPILSAQSGDGREGGLWAFDEMWLVIAQNLSSLGTGVLEKPPEPHRSSSQPSAVIPNLGTLKLDAILCPTMHKYTLTYACADLVLTGQGPRLGTEPAGPRDPTQPCCLLSLSPYPSIKFMARSPDPSYEEQVTIVKIIDF